MAIRLTRNTVAEHKLIRGMNPDLKTCPSLGPSAEPKDGPDYSPSL